MGDAESRALFNPIERVWDGILINSLLGIAVCIAMMEVVILMGGNHNHHSEWITVYPFAGDKIEDSHINYNVWRFNR